jgi:hypothetical protein
MILIDTPGTNDPKKSMSDAQIYIEMTNAVRLLLSQENEGITSITQCIIPQISKRLHHSVIEGMASIFLMLSSFYEKTDLSNHPRLCVVFNNISKFDKLDISDEIKKTDKKDGIKTKVSWEDFITEYREILLEVIKAAYINVPGFDEAYLKERIEKLLPDSNFYFYQMNE